MEISFLYPVFIFGTIFVSIPIIIHLLQKKKIVKLQFSTTLFFKSSALKKTRFRKINQILQLLIRILIVLTLITLFAAPFKNSDPFNKLSSKKMKIFCWIDQSLSMDLIDNDKSLIEISNEILNSVDSILPGDLQIFENRGFSPFNKNMKFKTSSNPPQFINFLKEFKGQNKNDQKAILVISDFQKSSNDLKKFIEKNTEDLILAIDMHPNEIDNFSIDSIKISESSGKKIVASISKKGELKSNSIELISNSMRRGHENITFVKNDNQNVSLSLSDDITWGELQLSKDDCFTHDNKLFFSERKKDVGKILIIKNRDEFSTLEEVVKTVIDSAYYEVTTKPVAGLKAEDIEESELIILNSLTNASSTVYSLLKPGFFRKKSIIFSPSNDKDSKIFNNEILRYLDSKRKYELIDSLSLSPSKRFSSSYLWNSFSQKDLNEIKIKSQISNIPGTSLLKSGSNTNLLTKMEDSKGSQWIVSSIELESSNYNNLSTTGFYIPLVDKLIKELKLSGNISLKGYTTGKTFTTPISDLKSQFEVVGLSDPSYKQIFNTPFITINTAGVYKIKNSDNQSFIFPINFDEKELILNYSQFAIQAKQNNLKIIKPKNINNYLYSFQKGNFEKLLIILLILLILSDLFLTILLKGKSSSLNSTI